MKKIKFLQEINIKQKKIKKIIKQKKKKLKEIKNKKKENKNFSESKSYKLEPKIFLLDDNIKVFQKKNYKNSFLKNLLLINERLEKNKKKFFYCD